MFLVFLWHVNPTVFIMQQSRKEVIFYLTRKYNICMGLAVVVKGEHERQKLEALRCKNRSWVLE